ncbi:MAG: SRPBCC family protein [Gammaproteobacteria bacterium]|nr:SRPBCC family protein [Gammaproteobacteria bacterium]
MRLKTGIDLECSPQQAFTWVDDPVRAKQWQINVSHVEILKETEQRVGTTFVERLDENGRGTELHGYISEYEPNSIIAFHLEGDYNVVDVRYTVSPLNGGARLEIEAKIRFRSLIRILSLFMGPVFKRQTRQRLDEELLRLQQLCKEEKVTHYSRR